MTGHGVAWLIGGTAGEGLESAGESFATALASCGYRPTTQRDFPSRIRGGDTTFTVRLTPEGFLAPPGRIDLALAFNDSVLPRVRARLGPDSLLLVDEGIEAEDATSFPFSALAEATGLKRAKNMVALGASAALMGLPLDELMESVTARFARKGPEVVAQNQDALRRGHAEAVSRFGAAPRFPAPAREEGSAWFLSGNQAASLGALAAGCRVAVAYPITPASDVLEFLTPRLKELGGVAVQAEDEMAALNACLGAGYAGAKALTATSGPGLSLMSETMGLAAATETPVVVLDCQRPGPSTGMPTKHGQDDLWHLVFGGHGEDVRTVLAPMDVADAFRATSEAFRLAERFRCPAFVALDQQCSLMKQTVGPLDLEGEAARHPVRGPSPAAAGSTAWDGSFLPYGDPGADPQRPALPGEPGGVHFANSTEHGPTGFTNEVPAVRDAMVRRRLERMEAIVKEVLDPVVVTGPADADVVLMSWGSTTGACHEAAARLAEQGSSARVVAVRLLWPFPRDAVADALGQDVPVFAVEANSMAQLARLVKGELPVHDRLRSVLRYDGVPVGSDEVLAAVKEVLA